MSRRSSVVLNGVIVRRKKNPLKFCEFPGCEGGCHVCATVQRQRELKPLFDAACRVLFQKPSVTRTLDPDVRLVAEFAHDHARPTFDEKTKRWIPHWSWKKSTAAARIARYRADYAALKKKEKKS